MSFLQEYTLLGELGQGGFAKVYKVRHNELGYIRAIRVLNEPVTDEKSRTYQKFLRECKVLLRLGNGTHPNIVHIYQPRLLENHALVEMDFVDGKNLIHYLESNGHYVPTKEVLRMVKEISSALAYCHEDIYRFCMDRTEDKLQDDPNDGSKVLINEATRHRLIEKYKVIHNDIHSGNIIRRDDGSFVLLDFGLAITGADDVRNSSRHENGAMEYKAPEKWDDDTILTEQSDIYSFGIVMYEYLAGRVPFPFDTTNSRMKATFAVCEAHKSQTPPSIFDLRKAYFEEINPGQTYEKDYPDWLEDAIMKCLEKEPEKRFHNGKELFEFISLHLKQEDNKSLLSEAEINDLKEKIRKLETELAKKDEALAESKKLSGSLTNQGKIAEIVTSIGRYIGDVSNGMPHGKGVLYYKPDSSCISYEGDWENGKANGKGLMKKKNGDIYDGEYRDGIFNGHGIYYYIGGNRYEGEWKKGNMNGHGIMYYASGDRYEGEWKLRKSGHGTYYWVNGDKHVGEFKDGERNGLGTLYRANGDIEQGHYINGKEQGEFLRTTKDGKMLKAVFENGIIIKDWH